jgi:hypothetical protein
LLHILTKIPTGRLMADVCGYNHDDLAKLEVYPLATELPRES